jgi:hypothetical protein
VRGHPHGGRSPARAPTRKRAHPPAQVFVAAAAYLSSAEIHRAARVCRSWRAALHCTAWLWRHLTVDVDRLWAIDKAAAWCQRTGRALQKLTLSHSTSHQWDSDFMQRQMEGLRAAILDHDGGSQLCAIEFHAVSFDLRSVYAMDRFCSVLLPPEPHSAWLDNIQAVTIFSPFPHLPVQQLFMQGLKHIPQFSILANQRRMRPRPVADSVPFQHLLDYLKGETYDPDQQSATYSLALDRVVFHPNLDLPAFPNLMRFTLRAVSIGRHFLQILQHASALEFLSLEDIAYDWRDIMATSAVDFIDRTDLQDEDLQQYPELQDEIDITLPALRQLHVSGKDAPAFWQHHEHLPWLPDVEMPNLQTASFVCVAALEQPSSIVEPPSPRRRALLSEWHPDGSDDDEDELYDTQFDALWSLCSQSKRIAELKFFDQPIGDTSLIESVRTLSQLERLTVYHTDVGDWGIESLVLLAPSLQFLDVRGSMVSPRAIARVVEGIRERGGRLCEVMMDDPGPFYDQSEASMWDHIAFQWLDWVGVMVEWDRRSRKEAKLPWQPPGQERSGRK